jgi:hypothetical protein
MRASAKQGNALEKWGQTNSNADEWYLLFPGAGPAHMEHAGRGRVRHESRNIRLVVVEHNARGELLLVQHAHLQTHGVVGLGDVACQRSLVTMCHRDFTHRFYHLFHQKQSPFIILLEIKARIDVKWSEPRSPGVN